jgi:hypothetical protein
MPLKTKAKMQENFSYTGTDPVLKEYSDNKFTLEQALIAEVTRLETTATSVLWQNYTDYKRENPTLVA